MPTIYISKDTRHKLDVLHTRYISEKNIDESVAHFVTDDFIIREILSEVKL